MADSYDRYDNEGSGGGFMMGLLTGTVLGAGLGMLPAPKAGSEMRGAIGEQARNLGSMASDGYRRASEQAGGWAAGRAAARSAAARLARPVRLAAPSVAAPGAPDRTPVRAATSVARRC